MTARTVRRVVLLSAGGGLILVGVVLLFLPGPGLLAIFSGLALLAAESAWARLRVKRAREITANIAGRVRGLFQPRPKK